MLISQQTADENEGIFSVQNHIMWKTFCIDQTYKSPGVTRQNS